MSIRLIGVGAEGISLERFEPIESFALPFLLGNLYFRVSFFFFRGPER